MDHLQTTAPWDVLIPKPHTFCNSHVFIYSFNTRSLPLHINDVDYNLKTSYILWFKEMHFNANTKKTPLNINTTTHSTISVNGRNVTMIIYDNFTTLSSHETFTYLGVEYIATTFNVNTRKAIHVITIYKPSTLTFSMF